MSKVAKPADSAKPARRPAAAPLYRFDGPIQPVRPSFLYLLGLAITAFCMVLLPLAYLGVIAAVGYAIYWHTSNADWLGSASDSMRPRTRIIAILVGFVGPLVAGIVTILFLLKPLLARSSRREEPVTLDRSQEPRLYEFLEQLCQVVGAPFPRQIEVSTVPNAAASFRRGWLSFFGRDFSLHLGLTLAAGMSLKQFAGTIAHELGHFSQGGAMRLSYIIRTINAWFARAAYQRDQWDAEVTRLTRSEGGLAILGYMIKLLVWLVRRVIVLFVWIGDAVSCSVSRQMEYNADQYEARLTGSEEFARSTRLFAELSVAMSITIDRLQADWREKRLVDNLPMLVAHTADRLPEAAREWVDKEMAELKTGLFSTHPSARRRIEAVEQSPHPGVMHADGPAHALFANFTMVANGVTLRYYRDVADLYVSQQNLIPMREVAEAHQAADDHLQATGRYFQWCISLSRPLGLGESIEIPSEPRAVVARLKAARAKFEPAIPALRALYEKRHELIRRIVTLNAASALIRTKIKKNPKEWDLPAWTQEAVEAALVEARAERSRLEAKTAAAEKVTQARVVAAVSLGTVPAIAKRLDRGAASPELLTGCLCVIHQIESVAASVRRLDELVRTLAALFAQFTEEGPPAAYPLLPTVVDSVAEEVRTLLDDVRTSLDDTPYPFENAGRMMTAAQFLGPKPPPKTSPVDVYRLGELMYDRIRDLHGRSLGIVASHAEAVEALVGLPPLPKPAPPDAAEARGFKVADASLFRNLP